MRPDRLLGARYLAAHALSRSTAVLLTLISLALLPADAGAVASGSPSFPAEMRDTAALMLRLVDLSSGYQIGDDSGCGIGTENAPDNLAQAIVTHLPEACSIEFEHRRLSPYIESSALTFHTPDGPAVFFALAVEWLKYSSTIEQVEAVRAQDGLGDEARLALIPDAYIPGGSSRKRTGAVVFWRRGSVLASVYVAGPRRDRATRMALRLAVRQDERIRMPTPIGPRDNDDLEVPLADPRLGVPVQWLGRRFAPGHGLPPLRLAYTHGPERRDPEQEHPNPRARLEYEEGRRRALPVLLDIWRPADWRRVDRSLSSRQLWKTPCARARRIRLAHGHAVVYAGYARLPRSGCPVHARDSFAALAFFRGVVVAVNMPYCDRCAEKITGRRPPYDSVKGMVAVVRNLRVHGR